MLLEKAIGDAYGLGFEFAPREKFAQNDLSSYLSHGLHPIVPGCYSDDTQMALAVAEVILIKGPKATRHDFAEAFVHAFRRDPRLGYAKGFHALLSKVTNGEELLATIKPSSTRGGAAMRAAPLGLLTNIEDAFRLAEMQAVITHDTPQGVDSAQAVVLAVHSASRGTPPGELRNHIAAYLGDDWKKPFSGGPVNEDGVEIVNAALTAVEMSASLSDVLKTAVGFMGDTDTVAAIAMGIASCCASIDQTIPQNLLDGLENGRYGRDHLIAVDARLQRLLHAG